MAGIENNATFWQKLDTILLSSNITIDRPKGTCHFKYKITFESRQYKT